MFTSRSRAQAAIIAGDVRVNGQPVDKAGALFDDSCRIDFIDRTLNYVSRGALKLEAALDIFSIDVGGLVVLDGGASTGGFTDCLLRRGAKKVIAVDVGYGQIAWKLRQDKRVELHERVNLRYLRPDLLSELAALATVDVSFISVTKVMPAINESLIEGGQFLLLIKPQFEVGKGRLGKGGVVKDPDQHRGVLDDLCAWMRGFGLIIKGITYSPILGAKGNIEFWLYLTKVNPLEAGVDKLENIIEKTVLEAHRRLSRVNG